ncbi:UNVERIFIED_CONTAM: putative ATPase N2B [Sesamum calycinum]|uniref:ATPase N2B n=1 Tax=Sesamum calycinum TaxID=2727403 RepID=A0AAW2QWT8_9LAMI
MKRILFFLSSSFSDRPSKFRFTHFRLYCDRAHSSVSRRPGPLAYYKSLVNQRKLKHDPYQEKVALELDSLLGRLDQYEKDMEEYHANLAKWEENRENERRRLLMEEAKSKQQGDALTSINKRRNIFQKWMSRKFDNVEPGVGKWVSYLNREKKLDSLVGKRPTAPPAPKGLYIYGNVGSGKTMLMDMFYSATERIVQHRRRLHFHEAMLQIHDLMHKVWKSQEMEKSLQSSISNWVMNLPFDTKIKEWLAEEERYKQEMKMKNILPAVADKFLVDRQGHQRGSSILCFDEIQTVDVFAIVALSGIVSRLLSTGTILVATSNRAPRDLNQDGMQREIFQEFVARLEEHCEIVLIGSEIDYRRHIAESSIDQTHYFWPLDSNKIKEYENMWSMVVSQSGGRVTSQTLPVMFGRTLEVSESCNGAARFTFEYLCGRPIGAADYIAIAKTYHTVFIGDIPVMSMRIRDKVSRLIEMQTPLYLEGVSYLHPYFQEKRTENQS